MLTCSQKTPTAVLCGTVTGGKRRVFRTVQVPSLYAVFFFPRPWRTICRHVLMLRVVCACHVSSWRSPLEQRIVHFFFFRWLFGSGLCCGMLVYTFALVGFLFLQVYASCEDCFSSESNAKKNEQNENKRALAKQSCLLCFFLLVGRIVVPASTTLVGLGVA